MKITFLGAALTVTGSKYLIEDDGNKILVDCGMFQGFKELRMRNWAPLPVDPKSIQAVILTHAHLDHTGYLPVLVRNGFRGPVYATQGTADLTRIILLDSGHLQEEDAKRANKYGYSKHKPALPLYTEKDAEEAIKRLKPIDYYQTTNLANELNFSFSRSGHIVGSAFVTLKSKTTSVVFSGDLGRPNDPIMKKPDRITHADYLLLESTYGSRTHPENDVEKDLADTINSTIAKKGIVLIASFAVGRAQTILYYISKLKKDGKIPRDIPVYLDSPMGRQATEVFCNIPDENKLPSDAQKGTCSVARYIQSKEESQNLSESHQPCIIIASSGMAEGGRILFHLKAFGPDEKNTIVFAGFQAGGTRGDRLLSGETEIKIFGEMIPIRAHVTLLENLSSHADANELLEWLKGFESPPKKIFLTHGEGEGAEALKRKIQTELGWNVEIPKYLESQELS